MESDHHTGRPVARFGDCASQRRQSLADKFLRTMSPTAFTLGALLFLERDAMDSIDRLCKFVPSQVRLCRLLSERVARNGRLDHEDRKLFDEVHDLFYQLSMAVVADDGELTTHDRLRLASVNEHLEAAGHELLEAMASRGAYGNSVGGS